MTHQKTNNVFWLSKMTIITFTVSIVLASCSNPIPRPIEHFVDLSEIQKVEIRNVKGKKTLSPKLLEIFIDKFKKCTTEPELAVKTGSLAIIFTLKSGETFVARGDDESDYLEITSEFATQNECCLSGEWMVLNTNGVNFHNF